MNTLKLYLIFFWKFFSRTFLMCELVLLFAFILIITSDYIEDLFKSFQYYANIFLIITLVIATCLTVIYTGASLLLHNADKNKYNQYR